jgi:Family of unknown function (DUF5999)
MRSVGVARACVQHGAVGLGVLAMLPVVTAVRNAQAVRAARSVPGSGVTQHTPGDAAHTPGEAVRTTRAQAQGDRKAHRRSRRVTDRRTTSEMVIPMCSHHPACPSADAADHDAAKVVVTHPDQGWSLLCNGVVLFDDLGEILPDGHVRGTGRQQQVALLRRYGSRRRRAAAPSRSTPRAA